MGYLPYQLVIAEFLPSTVSLNFWPDHGFKLELFSRRSKPCPTDFWQICRHPTHCVKDPSSPKLRTVSCNPNTLAFRFGDYTTVSAETMTPKKGIGIMLCIFHRHHRGTLNPSSNVITRPWILAVEVFVVVFGVVFGDQAETCESSIYSSCKMV